MLINACAYAYASCYSVLVRVLVLVLALMPMHARLQHGKELCDRTVVFDDMCVRDVCV